MNGTAYQHTFNFAIPAFFYEIQISTQNLTLKSFVDITCNILYCCSICFSSCCLRGLEASQCFHLVQLLLVTKLILKSYMTSGVYPFLHISSCFEANSFWSPWLSYNNYLFTASGSIFKIHSFQFWNQSLRSFGRARSGVK